MGKRLVDYTASECEGKPGDLILLAHGGGYLFAVADNPPDHVIWGDVRMRIDPWEVLICEPVYTDPAAGLLIGRWFATPEEALAAVEPYEREGPTNG